MKRSRWICRLLVATLLASPASAQGTRVVSVTEHGAEGDGEGARHTGDQPGRRSVCRGRRRPGSRAARTLPDRHCPAAQRD